jgi:hypothetical protein
VERAGKHRALSAVRLLTTRLNSALDLQDRIRKIADGSSATSIHGPMSRIH